MNNDGITIAFGEDGKARMINEDYCIYCADEKTFKKVKDAVEKHRPKKPEKSGSGRFYICPGCNKIVKRKEQSHGNRDIPHCKWCGQAWNWSEEE